MHGRIRARGVVVPAPEYFRSPSGVGSSKPVRGFALRDLQFRLSTFGSDYLKISPSVIEHEIKFEVAVGPVNLFDSDPDRIVRPNVTNFDPLVTFAPQDQHGGGSSISATNSVNQETGSGRRKADGTTRQFRSTREVHI